MKLLTKFGTKFGPKKALVLGQFFLTSINHFKHIIRIFSIIKKNLRRAPATLCSKFVQKIISNTLVFPQSSKKNCEGPPPPYVKISFRKSFLTHDQYYLHHQKNCEGLPPPYVKNSFRKSFQSSKEFAKGSRLTMLRIGLENHF